MRGMKPNTAPTDTLPQNKIELSLIRGMYHIEVSGKRSRLKVMKKVPINGDWHNGYEERPIFIPVTTIKVNLIHRTSADAISYRFTKMGSKESVTCLKTGQPPTMVRTKLATGPEMVQAPGTGKPTSTNVNRAAAEIDRMTKMGWREARRLFNLTLLEAGVVGQEGKTIESIEQEAEA